MEKPTLDENLKKEFKELFPSITLSSSSENRLKLLEECGVNVSVFKPKVEEVREKDIIKTVMKNASLKNDDFFKESVNHYSSLSFDTLLSFKGEILGKPKDKDDARKMLTMLSGKRHIVYTGCSIIDVIRVDDDYLCTEFYDKAFVYFRNLTSDEIENYLNTGEYIGAAGGYRIQKTGYTLIDKIIGDWTTVIGVPIKKLIEIGKERF